MYFGQTLFSQVMNYLPWTTFARIVDRYAGDRKVRTLRCTEHYRALAFAQITAAVSGCVPARLGHLGPRPAADQIRRFVVQ